MMESLWISHLLCKIKISSLNLNHGGILKSLYMFFFVATSVIAQVDIELESKAAVLEIVRLNDSRISLNSCGTNDGTYAFHNPSGSTIINCQGTIIFDNRSVLIFKKDQNFSYFEVSKCSNPVGEIDSTFSQYSYKCNVRALETDSLKEKGAKRSITLGSVVSEGAGHTSFKFKHRGDTYEGILVNFSQLMQDKDL